MAKEKLSVRLLLLKVVGPRRFSTAKVKKLVDQLIGAGLEEAESRSDEDGVLRLHIAKATSYGHESPEEDLPGPQSMADDPEAVDSPVVEAPQMVESEPVGMQDLPKPFTGDFSSVKKILAVRAPAVGSAAEIRVYGHREYRDSRGPDNSVFVWVDETNRLHVRAWKARRCYQFKEVIDNDSYVEVVAE